MCLGGTVVSHHNLKQHSGVTFCVYCDCLFMEVAFGMDVDVISEKDTKFTEAVALSFHGVEEASFDMFHKVIQYKLLLFCIMITPYIDFN